MLTKRIIPCLDIKDGRTVKGIKFEKIRDAGDPIELASYYARQGADELVFLDISATEQKRKTLASLVRDIARHINIPFTVGGGINDIASVETLLEAGADKVSVNSAAVNDPNLLNALSKSFGAQLAETHCVDVSAVLASDHWHARANVPFEATENELRRAAREGWPGLVCGAITDARRRVGLIAA
jgi:cyclase